MKNYLQIKLRILNARLKAQRNFCMNTAMQIQADITEAELREVVLIMKEENAAPDLLSALKRVRLQIGMIEHNWSRSEKTFMPSVIDAIKKAEK